MSQFRTINITSVALAALEAQTPEYILLTPEQLPDGSYNIEVDPEVLGGLRSVQHKNETLSDVIIRLAARTH